MCLRVSVCLCVCSVLHVACERRLVRVVHRLTDTLRHVDVFALDNHGIILISSSSSSSPSQKFISFKLTRVGKTDNATTNRNRTAKQ